MFKIESIKPFCLFLPLLLLSFAAELHAGKCAAGKQILWYYGEPNIDAKTYDGFSNQLLQDLSSPLVSLGYCLTMYESKDAIPFSSLYRENLVMRVVCRDVRENNAAEGANNQIELIVDLVSVKDFETGNVESFPDRPLVSLSFTREDMSGMRIVFEKKIIEHLRTQYICNLMITSDPPGVKVTAHSGLCDMTPFEWVVPVGKLDIQCDLKGHITYSKEIILDRPGVYNYFLQMKKRQLYNSKFFFAGAGCAVASGICFYFDNFYYSRYKNLGENDATHDPGSFERTYNSALTFERLSLSFLVLSCSFIGLSIWF